MKISQKQISEYKQKMNSNDVSYIINLLDNCNDEEIFDILKEQKILLVPIGIDEQQILKASFLKAVDRILKDNRKKRSLKNYVEFVSIINPIMQNLSKSIDKELENFEKNSLKDMLIASSIAIRIHGLFALEKYSNFLKENTYDVSDERKAEVNAYALHMMNGYMLDLNFAITNMLNLFAKKWGVYDKELNLLMDTETPQYQNLIRISSLQVSYQHVIDKISYSEWNVAEIDYKSKTIFKFNFEDKRLNFAREMGIRSNLVSLQIKKKKARQLRLIIEPFINSLANDFIDDYISDMAVKFYPKSFFYELYADIKRNLDIINIEDEILILYSDPDTNIFSSYVILASIRCFYICLNFFEKNIPKKNTYLYNMPEIPIHFIKEKVIKEEITDDKNFDLIVNTFVSVLPTDQHLSMIGKNNIIVEDKLMGMPEFLVSDWCSIIRASFYKGGKVADIVGKSWESYISDLFKEHDWEVIGRGLKINKDLPDIDVVVMKNNLLLFIQVKTSYGTASTTFEQWKSRNKILKGIDQSLKIKTYVEHNSSILNKFLTRKHLSSVKRFEYIVLTNAHIFNGWNFKNIPVVSLTSLGQILNGTNVKFESENGLVLSTKQYVNNVTTEKFIQLLKKPLDWLMANEILKSSHEEHESEYVTFLIPYITRQDGSKDLDVIPLKNTSN